MPSRLRSKQYSSDHKVPEDQSLSIIEQFDAGMNSVIRSPHALTYWFKS